MTTTGKNRIMIFGPRLMAPTSSSSGRARVTCWRSRSRGTETAAIRHFQERMPYGLYVPDEYPEGQLWRS